jgi:L-aspartate oxidase
VQLQADFLIVGSGIAGLRAAVELADAGDIVVLTKGGCGDGSTGYAQGGIAAAMAPNDSTELHRRDTMEAGDGLCDQAAVEVLIEEGVRYVNELIEWGVRFDREPDGRLALAREGAHSVRRVLHARDATGRELERVLLEKVAERCRPRLLLHAVAVDGIRSQGECVGMRFVDEKGRLGVVTAGATLIATGGAGQVFRETTNPQVASGDGVSIAYRMGAEVADLEFVQFHPTALRLGSSPRFLVSEALRGEGAQLVNETGRPFMHRYHPLGELAPRDVVARAIVKESQETGGEVYLTMSHLDPDFVRRRFPSIARTCLEAGLDLAVDRIPVGPAAHYVMGGVTTDLHGRTSVPRLYAAGEVACTGVHGANRLASNSLLEGLVFGARAGMAMRKERKTLGGIVAPMESERTSARRLSAADWLTGLMWESVGLFRDADRLGRAEAQLREERRKAEEFLADGFASDTGTWQAANLATVAHLITLAALRREESRGAHFRTDFPYPNDLQWRRRVRESRFNVETRTIR